MVTSISSFEIISVVIADPKIFFWIVASIADAAAVYPNVIKKLSANSASAIFINDIPTLINGPRNLLFWFITFFFKDLITFN